MIVVDVGNTRAKFSRMNLSPGPVPRTLAFSVVAVGQAIPRSVLENWIADDPDQPVIVDGSNPAEIERVIHCWPLIGRRPRRLERGQLPLAIDVDYPEKVGIDRLLNAIAANARRQPGQSTIIVDSGTATTVDRVDGRGVFCGGAILPGFEMGAKALHQYTALLPLIQHHRLHDREPSPIGRNTTAALESGLYWGHVGGVRELITRMSDPAADKAPLVLLTGGAAPVLRPHLPNAEWDAGLCLQGLALAAAHR